MVDGHYVETQHIWTDIKQNKRVNRIKVTKDSKERIEKDLLWKEDSKKSLPQQFSINILPIMIETFHGTLSGQINIW